MFGIVYLITHRASGKRYVGITTRKPESRWLEHCRSARAGSNLPLSKAIRKYGIDAFDVTHLESCTDRAALDAAEIFWIEDRGSMVPAGYNLTRGGQGASGYKASEESKMQRSISQKGRTYSDAARANMSAAAKGRKPSVNCMSALRAKKGTKRAPEVGRKISSSLAGRKLSDSHIELMRQRRLGGSLTQSAKDAISRPVIADGIQYPSVGAAALHLGVSAATVSRRIVGRVSGYESIGIVVRRKKRTAEQKERMRARVSKRVLVDHVEYSSLTEAASGLNLSRSCIARRISVGTPGYVFL